jgi:hypothetical protein
VYFLRLLLAVAAGIASWQSLTWGRAEYLFRQNTSGSIANAAALVPYHALYVAGLAQVQPSQQAALLRQSLQLNRFQSQLWIQLALLAEFRQNDPRRAERYLLKAADVNAMYAPCGALANFYFRRQSRGNWFPWAAKSLRITPYDATPLFEQLWALSNDAARNAELIPVRAPVLLSYLDYLLGTDHLSSAPYLADQLILAHNQPVDRQVSREAKLQVLGNLLDRLLWSGQLDASRVLWQKMNKSGLISIAVPSDDKPLSNGGFFHPFAGHGFDWNLLAAPGVQSNQWAELREVQFVFSGSQPEQCHLLQQIIPLRSGWTYRLWWKGSTDEIPEQNGLHWLLHPVSSHSDNRTAEWQSGDFYQPDTGSTQSGEFFISDPEVRSGVLVLEYRRPLGVTRIQGTAVLNEVGIEGRPGK